jgi:hypothetical protein
VQPAARARTTSMIRLAIAASDALIADVDKQRSATS